MKIDILSLFPKMFSGPFDESILGRAQKKKLVEIKVHDLRHWSKDKHRTVDDRPYGGGVGMILKVEVIYEALKDLVSKKELSFPPQTKKPKDHRIILLDPTGEKFNQRRAEALSSLDHLILICGHYEGVDERVKEHLVHQEISIGDYILTGGELPAMVLTETVVRLIPGVLEKPAALESESFQSLPDQPGLAVEYPQYTRPPQFQGWKVPEILLSGDHARINAWRQKKSLEKTRRVRPDLLKKKT